MEQLMPFREVLEAIDQLSLDEQETLLDIVQRRIAERGRKLLAAEIQEARQEFGSLIFAVEDSTSSGLLVECERSAGTLRDPERAVGRDGRG